MNQELQKEINHEITRAIGGRELTESHLKELTVERTAYATFKYAKSILGNGMGSIGRKTTKEEKISAIEESFKYAKQAMEIDPSKSEMIQDWINDWSEELEELKAN